MAAIAYCTNCKANFTDPAEVASINSGEPFHCVGCASFAAANPAVAVEEQQAQTEHEQEAVEEEAEPAEATGY